MNAKDMGLLAVPPPILGDNLRFTGLASGFFFFVPFCFFLQLILKL